MRILSITLAIAVLLLGACTMTPFRSSVSARADNTIVGCCTFFIVPSDESIDTNSLVWRNFESQVSKALVLQGFARVENPEHADIGIVAAAGIGSPRTATRTVPLFGQTGSVVTSSNTTGNVNVFGNSATVNSNTTYNSQPQYGVVGTTQVSDTVYDRWLSIRAYSMKDKAPNGDFLETWQTIVVSSGSTGDVAVVAPYMIAAAQEHFGKTLSGTKTVTIMSGSKKVDALTQ